MITLSLWSRRFGKSKTWTKPLRSMTDSGAWTSISVPMITRMIFEWTFGYHVMFPLLRNTFQNPVCMGILLSHHHAPITGFVLLSCWCVWASPWGSHMCLANDDWCRHTESALRISLHHRRSKSHSRAIRSLVKLSVDPKSCCYDHLVIDDVWATPKPTIW